MGRDIIRTGFPTANTISMSGYLGSEVPDTHHCLDSTTLSPYGLNCPAFLAHWLLPGVVVHTISNINCSLSLLQLSALRLLRRATDSEIGAASFIVCCHFECFWWFTLIYCCPGLCFTWRMAPRWFRITLQWLRGLDTYCFAKCIVLFQGKERRIGILLRMQVFSWCCSCFEAGSDA